MRTTIRIDEKLLAEAKRQAAQSGISLTALIEQSLREHIYRSRSCEIRRAPIELRTSGAGGLRDGVDLDDSAGLLDLMEGLD
jgi:antitoxin component of RelBE/YafQ-DinJ toxin-antitoxin module